MGVEEIDAGTVAMLAAVIAAVTALVTSGVTALVQVIVVKRQSEAAQAADDAKRAADAAIRAADRKRDLYLRWLRWQVGVDAEVGDAMVRGDALLSGPGTLTSTFAHQLADFRAELLLYASAEVRVKASGIGEAWKAYAARQSAVMAEEDAKRREERDYRFAMTRAINETVLPYVEEVAALMRTELEALDA